MTVRSVEPYYGRKKRFKVCLEGGADLVLYPKELDAYGITEGVEISNDTYELILRDVLIPRARKRALHLLEKQDRTVANLSSKLKAAGYPDTVISDALSYVASYHYTDDERYAFSYVRYHMEGKSKRQIVQELSAKGVERDIIDLAIETEYTLLEAEVASRLLAKRGIRSNNMDEKERAKHYRYLVGKGFSYETAKEALNFARVKFL